MLITARIWRFRCEGCTPGTLNNLCFSYCLAVRTSSPMHYNNCQSQVGSGDLGATSGTPTTVGKCPKLPDPRSGKLFTGVLFEDRAQTQKHTKTIQTQKLTTCRMSGLIGCRGDHADSENHNRNHGFVFANYEVSGMSGVQRSHARRLLSHPPTFHSHI